MTTEAFPGQPSYIIRNAGPYPIRFPYSLATDITARVTTGGVSEALAQGSGFTVTPDAAADSGSLTLTEAAATAWHGATLTIDRRTDAQQGWAAVAGPREAGLEAQLDRTIRAVQDLSRQVADDIAVLAPGTIAAIVNQVLEPDNLAVIVDQVIEEIGPIDPGDPPPNPGDGDPLTVSPAPALLGDDAVHVLIEDAAGRAMLVQRIDGIDLKPSAALIDRLPGGDPDAPLSLLGQVLMQDLSGNAVMTMLGDGLDFAPSGALVGRINSATGLRQGVPFEHPHGWEVGQQGGVDAVWYTTDEWGGSPVRFVKARGLNFLAGYNRVMQLLASNGQSLAVGTDFTGSGENRAPIDHKAPQAVFDIIETPVDQEPRGWQSADGRAAQSDGLRIAPLPSVRQTPIVTAAATLADLRRRRALPQAPVIVGNHGYPGQRFVNIDHLSGNDTDAGNVWPTFLRWLDLGVAEAAAYGFAARAPYHVLIHGTADASTSKNAYRAFLDGYGDAVTAAVQAATGQLSPCKLVITQDGADSNAGEPYDCAQAQLEYCTATATAVLAGPLYPYPIWDGAVHPGVESTVLMSEIIAHAMAAVDAGESWTIGMPALSRSGTTVTIDFSATLRPDEVLDIAPDPYAGVGCANLGLEHSATTITAVSVGARGITVTLAAAVAGTISYAFQQQNTSITSPGFTAHRGRLRTSWSAPSFHLPGRELRRWLPSFKGSV